MKRYIDADKLMTWFDDHYDFEEFSVGYISGIIREQPTADVREVKRGKWINRDGGLATCSECGDRWGVYSVMNFCPNCGADMREEE